MLGLEVCWTGLILEQKIHAILIKICPQVFFCLIFAPLNYFLLWSLTVTLSFIIPVSLPVSLFYLSFSLCSVIAGTLVQPCNLHAPASHYLLILSTLLSKHPANIFTSSPNSQSVNLTSPQVQPLWSPSPCQQSAKKTSACCVRAPRRGATAQRPTAVTLRRMKRRRRRTWCLGRPIRTAWQRRWWTWVTSPLLSLHVASMRPCSRTTRIGWEKANSCPGSRFGCVCLWVGALVGLVFESFS